MTPNRAPKSAAHRPSRRNAIVAAAIRVFAEQGFADTSIQAVATEAGVAPTAVYYHFPGKEELFEAALRRVLEAINEVVVNARADDEPGDPEILGHVISAVWHWLEANPDGRHGSSTTIFPAPTVPACLQDEFEIAPHHSRVRLHRAVWRHPNETLGGGAPRQ